MTYSNTSFETGVLRKLRYLRKGRVKDFWDESNTGLRFGKDGEREGMNG